MSNTKKDKNYIVKIPVYISELKEGSDAIFGGISYREMIDKVKFKINEFNAYSDNIKVGRKHKVFEKHIKHIGYTEANFNGDPGLLLKITAFNTNYQDGFFEDKERLPLTSQSKIGSDTNFVLLFPRIYGSDPVRYKCQWVVMLYEDPNKENVDITTTAKLTLSKIIGIEIKNVKMNSVLESLRQKKEAPELNISFTTIEYNTFDESVSYPTYLVSTKIKTVKEYVYKNVPVKDAEVLISSKSFFEKQSGFKVVKRLLSGKHEFKVTQRYTDSPKDVEDKLQETIEEIYNERTQISEEDMKENLYKIDFILSKFDPILKNYLSAE